MHAKVRSVSPEISCPATYEARPASHAQAQALERSWLHAIAEHEQVLLQAVRGVTSEGIQWIQRSICFCKSADLAGSKLRKLRLLSNEQ